MGEHFAKDYAVLTLVRAYGLHWIAMAEVHDAMVRTFDSLAREVLEVEAAEFIR